MLFTPRSLATTRQPSLWIRPQNEFLGGLVDERLLPRFECDPSVVLLAGAVLGEQARPMFGVQDTSTQFLGVCMTLARWAGISMSIASRHRSMIAGYFVSSAIAETPDSAAP